MRNKAYWFGALLALMLFLPSIVHATVVAPTTIATDTAWTAEGSPYLLTGSVTIASDVTLSILPGTVIKATRYGSLEINGRLVVTGISEARVIFTSYHDDSVGGDTNNNGSATMPEGGDWKWIRFLPGSSGSIEYATIRYGGYDWTSGITDGQIIVEGASSLLRNIVAQKGHTLGRCVRFINSEAQLLDSDISGGNECVRIEGGAPILRGNAIHGATWAGIAVTADAFFGSPVISDNRIYENINYGLLSSNADVVDARMNWWGHDSGPANVGGEGEMILENVAGSILYDPWIGKTREPVIVIPGIMGSWQKHGEWVIDPILHTYDNLLAALRAAGYVDGETLFTFPYDWKISNILTAHYLKEKIAEVRSICGCSKVDIIAHSMGGLIARQYISSSEYNDDIDQVVFLGVPHRGAPRSYLTWEAGEIEPSIFGKLQRELFELEGAHLGYTSLFEYIHSYPISSVHELLPVYNYLRYASENTIRQYSDNYPINEFLENLNSEDSLQALENSRARFINIVGDTSTNDTVNVLRVVDPSVDQLPRWEHGYPEGYDAPSGDHGLEFGAGDKTVPLASATYFNVWGTQEILLNTDHGSLPTEAQDEIIEQFTDSTTSAFIHDWQMPNIFLLVRLFSPVDMQIIDPEGRKIGKNFISGEELNTIPGAFYSGFDTENEFIVIPNPLDGEYLVQVQGTGSGSYTVSVGQIHESGTTEKEFTRTIAGEALEELALNVNTAEPEALEISIQDQTPPEIYIYSPAASEYVRGDVLTVQIDTQDQESGIASLEIMVDGTIIDNHVLFDTFFSSLGDHVLQARAIDRMGNGASEVVSFRIIATTESTIADVVRAYSFGWITSKRTRDNLIKTLESGGSMERKLKRFLRILEAEYRKSINDQAYAILKEDHDWLNAYRFL